MVGIIMAMILQMGTVCKDTPKTVDEMLVNNYVGQYEVVMHEDYADYDTITNRKSNKKIHVEHVKTKSKGKYGVDKNGYVVGYNKKVKKNKKVDSYLIYNPKTNAEDDIIAVVDNGKIRGEKLNNCSICGKDKGNYTSVCGNCLRNREFKELPKMKTDKEEQEFYDWHYYNEETKKWELM